MILGYGYCIILATMKRQSDKLGSYSMSDTSETVFNYELTELEYDILKLNNTEQNSYIQETPPQKRLSDLHLLFLLRKDKANYDRILDKIRLVDWGVSNN